jgi:hypothetical protein
MGDIWRLLCLGSTYLIGTSGPRRPNPSFVRMARDPTRGRAIVTNEPTPCSFRHDCHLGGGYANTGMRPERRSSGRNGGTAQAAL